MPIAKFILIKTGMSLGVLSLTLTLTITLGLFENRLLQRVKGLQKQVSSLTHLEVRTHQATTLITAHQKEFAAFETCGFERSYTSQELPSSPSYAIEFGSTSAVDSQSTNKGVVFQEVSLTIPCLQDRDVFKLIEKLTNEGPGIFQIQEITITRMSALSEEILEKIAAGKPQALFDGRIRALWIHR